MNSKILILLAILFKLSFSSASTEIGVCSSDMSSFPYTYKYDYNLGKMVIGSRLGMTPLKVQSFSSTKTYSNEYKNARRVMDTYSNSSLKGKKILSGLTYIVESLSWESMGTNPSISIFEIEGGSKVVYLDYKRAQVLMSTYCQSRR